MNYIMNMNSNERLKYTIVVGNGFDICMGFKTRYSDFVESDEWNKMYKQRSKKYNHYSLLQYLNGKRYTDEWFDIEAALFNYVSKRNDGSFVSNVKQDKDDYFIVCKTLNDYLKNHIKNSSHNLDETCAGKFLKAIGSLNSSDCKKLYSFNFTPIESYAEKMSILHMPTVEYVHGQVKKDSLILGIEVDNLQEIAPGYSFLIKSNSKDYKSSKLPFNLNNSQEVVFFGFSLNKIDMGYFEEYFKMMETNEDQNKRITIVTYDEDSKQQLLDNLRKSNISVQKLFTHSQVEIIKTKLMDENQGNADTIAFNELLKRL